jgi:hypothetical protein
VKDRALRGWLSVDAHKAFDKVERKKALDNLISRNIHPTLVAAIAEIYQDARILVDGTIVKTTHGVM